MELRRHRESPRTTRQHLQPSKTEKGWDFLFHLVQWILRIEPEQTSAITRDERGGGRRSTDVMSSPSSFTAPIPYFILLIKVQLPDQVDHCSDVRCWRVGIPQSCKGRSFKYRRRMNWKPNWTNKTRSCDQNGWKMQKKEKQPMIVKK